MEETSRQERVKNGRKNKDISRKDAKFAKQSKEFFLSGLCALATLREVLHFFHSFLYPSFRIMKLAADTTIIKDKLTR